MVLNPKDGEIFRKEYYEIYISDVVVYEINKCSREKREILLDYLDQIDYNRNR